MKNDRDEVIWEKAGTRWALRLALVVFLEREGWRFKADLPALPL
jgi:hypothetical protein